MCVRQRSLCEACSVIGANSTSRGGEKVMNDDVNPRREFAKKAVYVAPAILTLAVAPAYAKSGSEKVNPDRPEHPHHPDRPDHP